MYVNRADLIKQHAHGPCEGFDALGPCWFNLRRAFAAGATGQALPYGIALQDLSGKREHAWRKHAQIYRQMQAEIEMCSQEHRTVTELYNSAVTRRHAQ